MNSNEKKFVQEPNIEYQLAEDAYLKKVLSTSYTDRFHAMTRLMKLDILLKTAKITHKKLKSSC